MMFKQRLQKKVIGAETPEVTVKRLSLCHFLFLFFFEVSWCKRVALSDIQFVFFFVVLTWVKWQKAQHSRTSCLDYIREPLYRGAQTAEIKNPVTRFFCCLGKGGEDSTATSVHRSAMQIIFCSTQSIQVYRVELVKMCSISTSFTSTDKSHSV